MRSGHVRNRLAAFADGQLDAVEHARIAAHLATCTTCREAHRRGLFAASLLADVSRAEAPPHIWASIASTLDARAARGRGTTWWWSMRPVHGLAALVVLAMLAAGFWWSAARPTPWDVVRLSPSGEERMTVGDWIETNASSTARVRIGEIGTVDVAPGTRMQLLAARAGEHRLNLAEGRISAQIVAPPRLFFVETPVSTVVDLGCAYTMEVDQDGRGLLQVTSGWAALEWDGRESLVPAGASCPTRPARGPGTPLFDDASDEMRQALTDFDFGAATTEALDVVLAEARERDTLTLWHLMSRVEAADRARVFDRLVALTPLPAGVDRGKALSLDSETMTLWREELAWTW